MTLISDNTVNVVNTNKWIIKSVFRMFVFKVFILISVRKKKNWFYKLQSYVCWHKFFTAFSTSAIRADRWKEVNICKCTFFSRNFTIFWSVVFWKLSVCKYFYLCLFIFTLIIQTSFSAYFCLLFNKNVLLIFGLVFFLQLSFWFFDFTKWIWNILSFVFNLINIQNFGMEWIFFFAIYQLKNGQN